MYRALEKFVNGAYAIFKKNHNVSNRYTCDCVPKLTTYAIKGLKFN